LIISIARTLLKISLREIRFLRKGANNRKALSLYKYLPKRNSIMSILWALPLKGPLPYGFRFAHGFATAFGGLQAAHAKTFPQWYSPYMLS
jgi:hypothetical protein